MYITINNYRIDIYEDKYEVTNTKTNVIVGQYDSMIAAIEAAERLKNANSESRN